MLSPVILLSLAFRIHSSVWNLKEMTVTSVYWFTPQQQTSTRRHQKSRYIYSKFCVEDNELTPSFQKLMEFAWKLQKGNKAWKMWIYAFRGLTVRAFVINLQKYPKRSFFLFTWSMVTFSLKMISIESVFTSNHTFINP